VLDKNTEMLILGTLPSDISLTQQRYYANPGNDFWRIVGSIVGEPLATEPYERRTEILLSHRIGVWDAFHHCIRSGSLDENISGEELNDFSKLRTLAPKLRLILFNGKKAAHADTCLRQLGYETTILPSSSGANRKSQDDRLRSWKTILCGAERR
jgi:hypoxanthine-DNA glycosylase